MVDARVEAYQRRTDVVVRSLPGVVDARLREVEHPRLAKVLDVFQADGLTWVVEQRVEGEPLERSSPYSDKVLACGIELVPALEALAAAGLAHGDVRAETIVRTDDGLVLIGAIGPDHGDDVRALAAVLVPMLAAGAPANIRAALQGLAEGTLMVPLAELRPWLVRLRASIPLPPGRPVMRSIQKLAFPPPPGGTRRSKRYTARILLIVAFVGFALFALFGQGGAERATPEPTALPRVKDGVVFIRTTPLRDAGPSDGR